MNLKKNHPLQTAYFRHLWTIYLQYNLGVNLYNYIYKLKKIALF